eukprot:6264639-Ditylum_brightwellii.AAC.1
MLQEKIGTSEKNNRLHRQVVKERSGVNPPEGNNWRAGPGSNGIFLLQPVSLPTKENPNYLLFCQHGVHPIAVLDIMTSRSENKMEESNEVVINMAIALTSEWNGQWINCPNNIAI